MDSSDARDGDGAWRGGPVRSATVDRDAIRYRIVTLPAGTVIPLVLDSYVASDTSRIESPVRAHVQRAIVINGVTAVPAGSALVGHVTRAERGGRVKGQAHLAFRFDYLTPARSHQQLARQHIVGLARRTINKGEGRADDCHSGGGWRHRRRPRRRQEGCGHRRRRRCWRRHRGRALDAGAGGQIGSWRSRERAVAVATDDSRGDHRSMTRT